MNPVHTDSRFAVLFVDDEEKARKYFQLAYGGEMRVLTAGGVSEALDILEREAQSIGVLITDQRMPGQQGVDLLKRARDQWPDIVRMLTTAYSDLEDAITAVNRGEILRYVTKPWDLEALRVELRHAMEFFVLRHERNLLMDEKFSVRQRMQTADRLRDLLVIAAGMQRLRSAPAAVASWVLDRAGLTPGNTPGTESLELWGLEIAETLDLMALHRHLRALDQDLPAGFSGCLDLALGLQELGVATRGESAEGAVEPGLMQRLLVILKALAGAAPARLEAVQLENGARAVGLALEAAPGILEDLASASLGSEAGIGLFGAYLAAWHHGGSLGLHRDDEGHARVNLVLPLEPAALTPAVADAGWVEHCFARLEAWSGL